MGEHYEHLGEYSDVVEEAAIRGPLYPEATPGAETQWRVLDLLGFSGGPEEPAAVRVERVWERDGLSGEEVSWSLGYGPRAHGWVLKPSDAPGPLPGVIALHVQYDLGDHLFTEGGMRAAHGRITERYREAGNPDGYVGEFYEGPHECDTGMQESAFAWLKARLAR